MRLHFLLAPDKSSARRVRRVVAENHSRLGVVVGTWPELVEQARKSYLLPEPDDTWDALLAEAASGMKEAFWAKSLEIAPEETLATVGSSLAMLIEGAGPGGKVAPDQSNILRGRANRHLADLSSLYGKMGGVLPPHLAPIQAILDAPADDAIRSFTIYHVSDLPSLSPWQQSLFEKIGKDFPSTRDRDLKSLLYRTLVPEPSGNRPTVLTTIQDNLYQPASKKVKLDDSVQWLAVRDYLEEAEVTAGMVQKALKNDKSLNASDIGILIPSDRGYASAVRDAFTLAGLTLSGLSAERPVRDLGREALLYFLLCRRTPAPTMALAALLTSPLMPWSSEQGHDLAERVMNGDYEMRPGDDFPPSGKQMLALIRQAGDTPAKLADSVGNFITLLSIPKGMEIHGENARVVAGAVIAALRNVPGDIPWKQIASLAAPSSLSASGETELTREGIAVFLEVEEPWRNVRQLFVLGFGAGSYPAEPPRSAVFSEEDVEALQKKLGYEIETASDLTARRRQLFRRQLASASESMTFLISKRDPFGKPLQPSETLTFMARLFEGIDEPEKLLAGLDTDVGRASARGLAAAADGKPAPPRELKKADLDLGQDLLFLRKRADGTPKPESPSAIEILMVSPFGWLLERNALVPSEWGADELDMASKGTLAHEVFERLFQPGKGLPDEPAIRKNVPELLNNAVMKMKPMLLAKEWQVEYRHLQKDIETAALKWRDFLVQVGAQVIGAEVWLAGSFGDLPIHGKTDLLISLPGGRLYVVDYKKSKSGKRRDQMKKGFDSQASLYRIMLKTGGVSGDGQGICDAIKNAKEISVLYYMMNDQTVLADSAQWIGKNIAVAEELGENISRNALARIRERISELRKGLVRLNRDTDEEWFREEAGMNASYSLDKSPLVRLFMLPGEGSTQ